ncbi:MAG TPA: ABC transporter ATP-binding protein, partial [Verrucomicrobiae bacterium]
ERSPSRRRTDPRKPGLVRMPGLRIENLSKTFSTKSARVTALDCLNLEIKDEELLVVLGPSGCGKTTLLRIIAGLEKPDSGEIAIDSNSLLQTPAKDRNIGFAFQYPALLPQLTVEQNISLGPKLRGVSALERDERIRILANLLGLTELLPRLPETLSGGQQQRVSLARALATEPRLLLLDEPLANLDPTSRAELRDAIRRVRRQLRVTTIYVTHDQSEAAAIADRIAIVRAGALQQIGAASELYANPANLFVAEFFALERPNILNGQWAESTFRASNANFSIPTNLRHTGKTICVIRPAAIRANGPMRGKIVELTQTGWSTSALISTEGVQLRASIPPDTILAEGNDLEFSLEPSGVLFFNAEGTRLG